MNLTVEEFCKRRAEELGLELIAGKEGVGCTIRLPEVERPGLSLTGYLKGFTPKRMLVFGEAEIGYLKALSLQKRQAALKTILSPKTPCIFLSRRLSPTQEMVRECEEKKIPLLRSHLSTLSLMNQLNVALAEDCAPTLSCHGSLVEIFGIGVLIQGEAAVGKSEAALGLIQRGHRLISDDVVILRKREEKYLEGFGVDTSRHRMEIKGIGIINIAQLYGAAGVREKKCLDIVVKLEVWDDSHFYDRRSPTANTVSLLGMNIPFQSLPVKGGRDVVLLLETIALTHRLNRGGY